MSAGGDGVVNPSGEHGSVPPTNVAPPAPLNRRATSAASAFGEGGAFSLSRIFGSTGGGGFYGVGNDVTQAHERWRDEHDYDHAPTPQQVDESLQAEQRRLSEMGADDDDSSAVASQDPIPAPADVSTAAVPVPHPLFTGEAASVPTSAPSPTRPNAPRLHLPRLQSEGQSKAELNLSRISNPKVRTFLDPSDDSIRPRDLWDWSPAELQELVDAIEPQHLTGIIRKSVEYFASERCKPLSWDKVALKNPNGRYALRDVSGFLNPGQTVAILSAPDAGTTNLLNVLAGRQETGIISGSVLYDGRERDESFQRHVGYVVKDDQEFAMLTVKETLMFSAQCRTPYAPRKVIEFKVNLCMKLLGLSHAANTFIGDASIKGVSGGEKRRVSYGVEMVAGHGCILADLPTNGLDSASAYALIKTIRYINRSGGRSMMCSIVQPAPALYHLFDTVMLLSKGSVIYFGPTKAALRFVEEAGFVRPGSKSEPQFLEELTATPEAFYSARLRKEGRIDDKTVVSGQAGLRARNEEQRAAPRDDEKVDTATALQIEQQRPPSEDIRRDEAELKSAVEMMPPPERKEAVMEEKVAGDGAVASPQHVALAIDGDVGAGAGPGKGAPAPNEAATAADATKSATEAAPDEDVHEYTLGEERVMASPQRMAAWKLLVDRQAASVFHERVVDFLARERVRGEAEMRLLPGAHQPHHQQQQGGGGKAHLEPTQTADERAAQAKLSRFTGSMGVVEMARGRTELEMEERGPGGGNYHFNRTLPQQIAECVHRQFILVYRTPGLWFGSWVKATLMAVIAGTLFLQMPSEASWGRTRLGLFFFLCIYIGVGAVEILAFLMLSRGIYYKHRKAGYFRGLAYYISVMVSMVPLAVVETFIFSLIVYGIAGLRDNDGSSQFWFFWFVILMVNLTSRCWVFCISTLAPNAVVAFVIIPITNVLFVQFAGFLQQREAIPIGWRWMNYVSFYDWAWRALSVNELYNLELTPDPSSPSLAHVTSGTQILEAYSITDDGHYKWFDLLWLILFTIGFFCLGAFLILTVDWSRADSPQRPDFGEEALARKRKAQAHKAAVQQKLGNKSASPKPNTGQNATAGNAAGAGEVAAPPPWVSKQLSRRRSTGTRKVLNASYVSHQRDAYFQWQHLNYTVTLSNGTDRMLLTDCFGYARPGIMVALMGASGAGKSTLLDVLAGKKTAGRQEGEVLLNGLPFDAKSFNHTAAYGEQFDSHSPFSTVREAILFSALLRLPTSITSNSEEVERRVMHVMDVLDLQHSANDIIGAPGFGGVSPEVRKKVTIAVELVMDPALLFLDEPTTGLDSAGAYAVMSSVKKLAQQMAVVCTIHQPSNEIVHMFDWLLLLQPGGQVVFFGPTQELVPFFVENRIAEAPKDPNSPDLNVADFSLDAIRTANANKGKPGAVDMVQAFKNSPRYKQIQEELDKKTAHTVEEVEAGSPTAGGREVAANTNANVRDDRSLATHNPAVSEAEDDHNYAGFVTQLFLLTQRNYRSTYRNGLTFKTRYLTVLVLGFVCGTFYWHLDWSQQASSTRVSVLFTATIIPMFLSSSALAEVFAVRPLYFREYTSRMYGALPWFLARRLADVPYYFVEVTIFGTMLYWIAWMRHDNNGGYFFWFIFTLLGVRAAGSAFTQAVATAFATPEVASAFQSTAFTVFFLFAGFLIPEPLISNGWIWMYYLSFIRYPLDFMLANEFADVTFDCSDYATLSDCPVPIGNVILDQFGVKYSTGQRAIEIVSLWIFWGGFLFLGFLALRFINHIKR